MDLNTKNIAPAGANKSGFKYETYEPSVGRFLKSQAERIQRYVRSSAIQIGKDLIAGKRYLSHGEFHNWVTQEVGLPVRTAQAYMQVAHWAAGKSTTVTNLPPSLLYALSARTTPKQFSDMVLEKIEAGEAVTSCFVRKQLKLMKSMKKEIIADKEAETHCEIIVPNNKDFNCNIMEAVSIIFNGLDNANFERVKHILTQDRVLSDPQFNRKIALAFGEIVQSEVTVLSLHHDARSSNRGGRHERRATMRDERPCETGDHVSL